MMYRITVYYWFESPYLGRTIGETQILCSDNFEIGPALRQLTTTGVIIPVVEGMRRFIAPHQIVDTVIEIVKETQKDAKAEVLDTTRDEGLPIQTTRPRKAKNTSAERF